MRRRVVGGSRLAEVWTPLEPIGYVRVGDRLLPVRWQGPGLAPEVGGPVDLGDRTVRPITAGASHLDGLARWVDRCRGAAPESDY